MEVEIGSSFTFGTFGSPARESMPPGNVKAQRGGRNGPSLNYAAACAVVC